MVLNISRDTGKILFNFGVHISIHMEEKQRRATALEIRAVADFFHRKINMRQKGFRTTMLSRSFSYLF